MTKEYIAYEGTEFKIEWYFDEKGESQALDFLMNLPANEQRKVFYLFKRLGDFGKIHDITKFRNEGDSIYAFKPQPHRFLSFFFEGNKVIVTNAFRKKSQKLPQSEKDKALKLKENYLTRLENGDYYEKE
jgi:phage-related protein